MKSKDQRLLEEAYQSIYKLNEGMPEASPEGEAIHNAMMQPGQAKEKAKADLIGKYVTVYKKEMSQNFANKSDLPEEEADAGERLHSTSSVTGATPIAAGNVVDVLWQDVNNDIRLVLDTDDDESEERTKRITVPFGLKTFLVVRKQLKPVTQTQNVIGHGRYSGMR
jgi:hypothetical protein